MNHRDIAQDKWPDAEWIAGTGQWASVAYCRVTTIILFEDRAKAMEAKDVIDRTACGGLCYRDHVVVDLELVVPAA